MRRRRVLAAAASSALLPLAGCSDALSGPTDLGSPEEELDADGREKHLVFTRGSEEQAVVSIVQRSRPGSLDRRVQFRLHVWHREGLSIDRMRFELRAPPRVTATPADVLLQVPDGGPWPEFELRRDEQWTVVDVDGIGDLGDGSLGLDLVLDPVDDPVDELAVRTEVEFGEAGLVERRYRATADTRFDVLSAPE